MFSDTCPNCISSQLRRLSCTCSDLTEQLLASGNLTSTLQARIDVRIYVCVCVCVCVCVRVCVRACALLTKVSS